MKYILSISLLLLLVTICTCPFQAQAQQTQALELRLKRNFGYGGGDEIQGVFTMNVQTPQNIIKVEFFIDDQIIGSSDQAPFSLRFTTDAYPLGLHTLKAIGYANDQSTYVSNTITIRFVSAQEGWKAAVKITGPLLGVVVGILILAFLSTLLSTRGKTNLPPGTPRRYGFAGGAICPKCNRPTPLHLIGFNLLVGKLDRCENCGKWSVMRAQPLEILRKAEKDEGERLKREDAAQLVSTLNPEEKLKKEIEDSRFQDL